MQLPPVLVKSPEPGSVSGLRNAGNNHNRLSVREVIGNGQVNIGFVPGRYKGFQMLRRSTGQNHRRAAARQADESIWITQYWAYALLFCFACAVWASLVLLVCPRGCTVKLAAAE